MTYKVGDQLEILFQKHSHEFVPGEVVTVIRVCGDYYDACNKKTGDCWHVFEDEVKLFVMKEMTDAVLSAAKKMIKKDGEVIITDIKNAVMKSHGVYFWTFEIVEAIMSDACKAGMFKRKETIVKGNSHYIYSTVKQKEMKTKKAPVAKAATKKKAVKKTAKKTAKKAATNKSGNVIGKKKAHELMKNNKGHFFTAVFIDKKNEERTMNCQYLKDQENSELGYVKVKEAIKAKIAKTTKDKKKKEDFIRQINLQTLKSLKIAGNSYKIK